MPDRAKLEDVQKRLDLAETLTRAFMAGIIRWERWDKVRGELCFNGLRYAARLTVYGTPWIIPEVLDEIRAQLAKGDAQ